MHRWTHAYFEHIYVEKCGYQEGNSNNASGGCFAVRGEMRVIKYALEIELWAGPTVGAEPQYQGPTQKGSLAVKLSVSVIVPGNKIRNPKNSAGHVSTVIAEAKSEPFVVPELNNTYESEYMNHWFQILRHCVGRDDFRPLNPNWFRLG